MPGTPAKVTHRMDTPAGPIDIQVFTLDQNRFTYIISYSDYPEQILQGKNQDNILDGARDGAVAHVQGKLWGEHRTALGQYPGRELTIEVPDGQHLVLMRMYLVKKRLYQVGVATRKAEASSSNVTKFLESFKLLGK